MTSIISQIFPFCYFQAENAAEQAHINNLSQKVMKAARANCFYKNHLFQQLEKDVSAISPAQLKKILEKIAKEKEGVEALQGLARILSPSRLKECFGLNGADLAKDLSKEAQIYLEKTKAKASPSLSAYLAYLLDSIFCILECFINAFGIAEFFRPAESKSDARLKAQTIMMLLQFFTLVSAIALPLLGAGTAGTVVGSVLLSISALSLIYPYICRAPAILPHAENWTRLYQLGKLQAGEGRKDTVDKIARALTSGDNVKTHPLVLGKSGVGKTQTIKALVEAIEKGEYPELSGKQVFYINTADLINKEDRTRILNRLSEAMGRHRNDIILVFDRIHLTCQKRDSAILSEQLKTLLDPGIDSFPHVIGITTEEEFYRDIYSQNPDFARRFKRIQIENTPPVETVQILHTALLKQSPKILTQPQAFETLMKKTKAAFGRDAAEPASSLKVLSLCVKKASESQKSATEKKIENICSQLDYLHIQRLGKREEVTELEKQLADLKAKRQREKEAIERVYRERDQLAELKTDLYRSALNLRASEPRNGSTSEENELLLMHQLLLPTKEANIKKEAKELGVKIALDSGLIDEAIQEEKENALKAQRIVARARRKS